jgi:uncharacterized protein (DUF885 family)
MILMRLGTGIGNIGRQIGNAIAFAVMISLGLSCGGEPKKGDSTAIATRRALHEMLDSYWEQRMVLYPLEATANGDARYNDRLTISIAESFRDSLHSFYGGYLERAKTLVTTGLQGEDVISYTLFKYEMSMNLEGLNHPTHLMPMNQFWSFTLELPQLGSGSGNQPFETAADYDNWLKRASYFPQWADTAITNMRKGIDKGIVLPRALVVKMVPQLTDVIKKDTSSIFYQPVASFPKGISEQDRLRLAVAYRRLVDSVINPAYSRLATFIKNEYLPKCRTSSGISAIPGGEAYYKYCIRYWTTTELTADSIYKIGLTEVARIEHEMDITRKTIGYKGNLQQLFKYVSTDAKFCPFATSQQIIDSFWAIKRMEDPKLKQLFSDTPKTAFTIRQTEAFRAASASAEYNQGSADGTRPGVFYVPILDAKKFNATGMATLFLHEAIPGHHYQISLQQENKALPKFRRFSWFGAYGEGWAHYCETLGKGLGLYEDPYQYLGHLGDAQHRAIRLVVDAGIHSKAMTREEAIKYMMAHELITEHDATAEIERYMAIPGQALSYKIGQMAISGERKYWEEKLGKNFSIASFHKEVLKSGCLPLRLLHENLTLWGKSQPSTVVK